MFRSFHPCLLSLNKSVPSERHLPCNWSSLSTTPVYIFKPRAQLLLSFTDLTLVPQGPHHIHSTNPKVT